MRGIINTRYNDEMRISYLDYSMSVILSRALPDSRDGFKPVQRRILYAMYEVCTNNTYKKSARIVGHTLGNYHPHGDTAIYDAMVKMAQPFNMYIVLVDGQGNFGSIDGDKAAAGRYTEVKLSKAAHYMLEECNLNTVDYIPNYDSSTSMPSVLPARFPNLLVNGASGIAVATATNIPSHNLKEIMEACISLVDNPELTVLDLMKYVKGPDFNSTCSILVDDNLVRAYETGNGYFKIRAEHIIEEVDGKAAIVFKSIPYQVNKTLVIEKIVSLMKDKQIDSISNVRDESDRDGIRLVIMLKKSYSPEVVVNNLYALTQLQTTFHINVQVIDDLKPVSMSLKELLSTFIKFRRDIIIRRTNYILSENNKKLNDLKAMRTVVKNIDRIIPMLKHTRDASSAEELLRSQSWDGSKLSDEQIKVILGFRLGKLTSSESNKIEQDIFSIEKEILKNKSILENENELLSIMKEEFRDVIRTLGKERTTTICSDYSDTPEESLIEREDVVITISSCGYIKRSSLSEYRIQNKGGKGRSAMNTKSDDAVSRVLFANTHAYVLFFTSLGRAFKMRVYELPLGDISWKGKFISNILNLEENESLANILIAPELDWDSWNIIFALSDGSIRRSSLLDLHRANGKKAVPNIDSVVGIDICRDEDDIILISKKGKCVKFKSTLVRKVSNIRSSTGVAGMNLSEDDKVTSLLISHEGDYILTISEKGFGKRASINAVKNTSRNCKGVKIMNIDSKTGPLVSALITKDDDSLIMLTSNGNIVRCTVNKVNLLRGRSTRGVKLVSLDQDDKIISADICSNQ